MNFNEISGSLPLLSSSLSVLQVRENSLTGQLPTDIGSVSLVDMKLGGNQLTGSVPAELGGLASLSKSSESFSQFDTNFLRSPTANLFFFANSLVAFEQ